MAMQGYRRKPHKVLRTAGTRREGAEGGTGGDGVCSGDLPDGKSRTLDEEERVTARTPCSRATTKPKRDRSSLLDEILGGGVKKGGMRLQRSMDLQSGQGPSVPRSRSLHNLFFRLCVWPGSMERWTVHSARRRSSDRIAQNIG